MPIYVFRCPKCSYEFEKIVPINTKEQQCDKCHSIAKKDMKSFLTTSIGLPNGFHGFKQ